MKEMFKIKTREDWIANTAIALAQAPYHKQVGMAAGRNFIKVAVAMAEQLEKENAAPWEFTPRPKPTDGVYLAAARAFCGGVGRPDEASASIAKTAWLRATVDAAFDAAPLTGGIPCENQP